jgi:hypothetical protein
MEAEAYFLVFWGGVPIVVTVLERHVTKNFHSIEHVRNCRIRWQQIVDVQNCKNSLDF